MGKNNDAAARLKHLVELLHSKNAKLAEEDGSDLSVDMPGQGVSPSKLREYELGNENQPSKLQESDFDETPALPDKGSFENDSNLKSKSRKEALRGLRNRPLKR
jgi:hypothetical protein